MTVSGQDEPSQSSKQTNLSMDVFYIWRLQGNIGFQI